MNWFQKHIFSIQTWLLPMLFVWVSINVYGQEDEVDLYGNWQLQKPSNSAFDYKEYFVDETIIYIYGARGSIRPTLQYEIINNEILITKGPGEGESFGSIVILTPTTLIIEKDGVQEEFQSLHEAENTLGDFILEKIHYYEFWRSFSKRWAEWRKSL
ncbi:MAG: hypothetical protein AAGL34_08995 [Bacteroidota bacterium]